MYMPLWGWLPLTMAFLVVCGSDQKVCEKMESVPRTQNVFKNRNVPYTRRDWWGRAKTYWRLETVYEPQTVSKWEVRRYCCAGYTGSITNCEPVCRLGCQAHSYCAEPDDCQCNEGFEKDADGSCAPICSSCGKHSSCQEPEKCVCNDGYERDHQEDCVPHCSQGCNPNAYCAEPELCECNAGYVKTDQSCQAVCSQGCPAYGKCAAPEVCECYPGYELIAEHECRAKCSADCPNGYCAEPELCMCNKGYLMGPNSTCEAQCSGGCQNGICSAPDVCTCNDGYELALDHSQTCLPVCLGGCEHADCVAPNVCLCQVGYEPVIVEGQPPGNVCTPSCREACVNSTCSAPDQCSCNDGYVIHNQTTCKPHCQDCENGDCSAPGECHCWPGFERVGDICKLMTSSTEMTTTALTMTTTLRDESTSTMEITPEIPCAPEVDFQQMSPMVCVHDCKCWNEYDELGPLNSAKCVNICVDAFDQPCLDVTHCHCLPQSGQLLCNASNDISEESAESPEMRYVCKVAAPRHTKAAGEAALGSSATQSKWPIILGAVVGSCLVVAAAMYATQLVLRRSRMRTDAAADQADGLVNGSFEL